MLLSLKGPSNTTYASTTLAVNSNSSAFSYYETNFTSTQSYESDNYWELTFDATKVAGSALNFDLVQLFPSTYKDRSACLFYSHCNRPETDIHPPSTCRENGLRNDVATYLEQLTPSFLRFPGGNNM